MCAFLDRAQGPSIAVATVDERGFIAWDKDGLKVLGCLDENAAKIKLLMASRRTK
jgi:hypothetical protein